MFIAGQVNNVSPSKRCFVVLGCHRSGTSCLTGVLQRLGVWLGEGKDLLPASAENRRGYFERLDVIEANEQILRASGYHSCVTGIGDVRPAHADRIARIVGRLRLTTPAYGLKDPRFCHTLHCWLPHLDSPFILYIVRNRESVIRSFQKRGISYGGAIYDNYNQAVERQLAGRKHHRLTYEELLKDPARVVRRIAAACSLHYKEEAAAFVDARLNHGKRI